MLVNFLKMQLVLSYSLGSILLFLSKLYILLLYFQKQKIMASLFIITKLILFNIRDLKENKQ